MVPVLVLLLTSRGASPVSTGGRIYRVAEEMP